MLSFMGGIFSQIRVRVKLLFSGCHRWVSVQRTKKRQFHLGLPLILKAKLAHNLARAVRVFNQRDSVKSVHLTAPLAFVFVHAA
jgi:hypothetical protein